MTPPVVMALYYDREGRPLADSTEWSELHRDRDYCIVAQTQVGQIWVSTVWLGMDHGWNSPVPIIFETMAFGPASWSELTMRRYATEAEAHAGHLEVVTEARRHHHGWTKHSRDEARAAMKHYVRLLAVEKAGGWSPGMDGEMERAALRLAKAVGGRRRGPR